MSTEPQASEPMVGKPGTDDPSSDGAQPLRRRRMQQLSRWAAASEKRKGRDGNARHIFALNLALSTINDWVALFAALGLIPMLVQVEGTLWGYGWCTPSVRYGLASLDSCLTLVAFLLLLHYHRVKLRWMQARGAVAVTAGFSAPRIYRPLLLEALVVLVHMPPGVDFTVTSLEEAGPLRYRCDLFFAAWMLVGRILLLAPRLLYYHSLVYALEAWVLSGVVGVDVTPWLAFKVFLKAQPLSSIFGSLLAAMLVTAWGVRAFELDLRAGGESESYLAALYLAITLTDSPQTHVGKLFAVGGWFANVCLISLLTAALIEQIALEPAEGRIVEMVVGHSIRKKMLHAQISLIQWSWRRHFERRQRTDPELGERWAGVQAAMRERELAKLRALGWLGAVPGCAAVLRACAVHRRVSQAAGGPGFAAGEGADESEPSLAQSPSAFCLLPASSRLGLSELRHQHFLGEFRGLRRTLKGRSSPAQRGELPTTTHDEVVGLRAELGRMGEEMARMRSDVHLTLRVIHRQAQALARKQAESEIVLPPAPPALSVATSPKPSCNSPLSVATSPKLRTASPLSVATSPKPRVASPLSLLASPKPSCEPARKNEGAAAAASKRGPEMSPQGRNAHPSAQATAGSEACRQSAAKTVPGGMHPAARPSRGATATPQRHAPHEDRHA